MSDPLNQRDAEIETIRAFVVPTKRDRYVGFLSNEKRRREFVRGLAHFNDFDLRWIVRIAPSSQNPDGIYAMLKAHGAPKTCHAISELTDLDGKEISLRDAIQDVIGRQMGTILCCLPGRLAYFENEDTRFILERKK
jgi:hypothetical protein